MLRNSPPGLSIAALLGLLASCAVGPDYKRPDAPAPAAFKGQTSGDVGWKSAHPSDAEVRGNWWELYGDPQLNALEDKIAVSNQSLKAATAQYFAAVDQVRVARAGYFPTAGVAASVNRIRISQNQPNTVRGQTHFDYNLFIPQATAQWEPDLWGQVRRTVEQARADAQASAADLANVALSLHAQLAAAYFTLRGLDTQDQLLENTLASDADALKLAQVRFAGGVANAVDVAQAETQYKQVKAQAIDTGVVRAQMEDAIATLTGVPASAFALPPNPAPIPVPAIPVVVPSALLERRPDVAGAERRTAAANAQIGIAVAAYYPSLTLSAGIGFESGGLGNLLQIPSLIWSLGASAAETIFEGGRRHALTDQARDLYEAQVATYRETVLQAFQDVEDNLSSLRILAEEAEAQAAAVEAARQSLSLSNKRYKGGVTTYLEVLTAQTIQLSNERTQADIATRRLLASVQLIKALGGGWNPAAPAVSAAR
ncbi:MAG TPA: efflux transporter outer membrane subunit [Polyangia bacterium]|nr:efflux transporter outer membrane subunit [Polyangia bacterium]